MLSTRKVVTKKMHATQREFEVWQNDNPILRARLAKDHVIMRAATEIGVSTNAYRKWELGAAVPSEENMKDLAAYTGNDKIGEEIKAWFDAKPKATH